MNTEQELLERARACLQLGEMTGSRGKAPSNVYNVLSDLIDALVRRSSDEQAEVVADLSVAFAEWIGAGPKLAKAAGVYVGITVYDKDPSK